MMERLGLTMAGAPRPYGWRALATWARHLPPDAATWRAQHPDESAFASAYGRALIMADIFDAVQVVKEQVAVSAGARITRKAPPYPRPGMKDEGTQTIGSDPIPAAEFDAWYYGTE